MAYWCIYRPLQFIKTSEDSGLMDFQIIMYNNKVYECPMSHYFTQAFIETPGFRTLVKPKAVEIITKNAALICLERFKYNIKIHKVGIYIYMQIY